jgi:transcriptional regulator with XRE-family HTH domain
LEKGRRMNRNVQDILQALHEYEQDPESSGVQLRLDLATIILRRLKAKGWTQRQLAQKSGFKEPFISRLLHSSSNCTFDTAGRVLRALGVEAKIEEVAPSEEQCLYYNGKSGERTQYLTRGVSSEEEISTARCASTEEIGIA